MCGCSGKSKSTRSGLLTEPRGPLGGFGHGGSDVVVVDEEELSIRVHGMSGLDVNAAPNCHEVAISIRHIMGIDHSSDEIPSSVRTRNRDDCESACSQGSTDDLELS